MEKAVGDSATDAIRWMEDHGGWLLVLDSADDPSLNLGEFIPQTPQGNTVITSHNAQTSDYGRASQSCCEILDMSPDEAKTLFLWRAGLIKAKDEIVRLNDHEDGIVKTILKVGTRFTLRLLTKLLLHAHWQEVQCHDIHLDIYRADRFGRLYDDSRKYKNAEIMEKLVMKAKTFALGGEHPQTLISMGNLASTYWKQGRWMDTEKLDVTVVEAKKRVLGEEHPQTLISMGNLALTYRSQGRWTDAEKLQVTVLEASKRVIGEEHPDILESIEDLALAYQKLGRLSDAGRLEAEVAGIRKRLLVPKDREG